MNQRQYNLWTGLFLGKIKYENVQTNCYVVIEKQNVANVVATIAVLALSTWNNQIDRGFYSYSYVSHLQSIGPMLVI